MAAFSDDLEDEPLAIEDIITGMRRVIDQLPAAERKLILTSMRSKFRGGGRRGLLKSKTGA